MRKKNIVLGVGGSIACYKAADLTSRLAQDGFEVHVVMTLSATEFVAPLTFQTLSRNPVNLVAKLACGIADDALTSIALATRAPLVIAPAMNGKMWHHPATQENVERLKSRGALFIGPAEGLLACGYEGTGRLWEVAGIVEAVKKLLPAD